MSKPDGQGDVGTDNPWALQNKLLGEFIRSQRRLAKLSLRDLAARTAVSNPYLSQIERGLHEPSLRVLKVIAEALDLSAAPLLAQAGLLPDQPDHPSPAGATTTTVAIRTDPTLTEGQKTAMSSRWRRPAAGRASSWRSSRARSSDRLIADGL